MSIKSAWCLTKRTLADFWKANSFKLSASLAFFTVFSLPGLLIIIIWVSDVLYGKGLVEGSIYSQMESFVGHSVALSIQEAVQNAAVNAGSTIATVIGIVSLLIGATSVFNEIQDSINFIWKLKAKPRKGFAIIKMLLNRLLSFSMIISLGFILLVSLIINGAMDILLDKLMTRYPHLTVVLVYMLNLVLTFIITTVIFAAIFKVLPDARIKWRHVWVGAWVTAVLFMAGKFLISYYLGHSQTTTMYGAAGSVIIVLLWVYYSAMILYLGACFTHAYVQYKGSRIYPNSYAVWVQQIEVESDKSIQQQPAEKTVIETHPPTP
jgi:membrane protein